MMVTSCMTMYVISKSKIAHKTVQSALSKMEQFYVVNVRVAITLINYLTLVIKKVCVMGIAKSVLKENVLNVNKGISRKMVEDVIERFLNVRRTAINVMIWEVLQNALNVAMDTNLIESLIPVIQIIRMYAQVTVLNAK